MAFTQPWFEADFGSNYAAIATTGYRLYQNDNTDSVARTTTGVVDLGNGGYGVPAVNVPDNAVGIEWDTGGGSPVYAREDIEPFRLLDGASVFDPAADEVDIGEVKGVGVAGVADFKADVSALAIEANVEGHVTAGLGTYTAPTKAELDAAETNIIAEVDANEVKIDAITTTLSTLVTDIWAAGTRTLTSFGTLVADITTAVWAAGARTLTSFGTLVADIWAYGTRVLTGEVDIGAVKGVGVTDIDDFKADVSALATEANATSNKDEIIVEVDANETKIDAITSTLSTMVTDVWAAGTRTLTSFGTLVTDIWASGTRTLTSFGTLVADVATAVWGAVTRTLTGEVDIGAVKGVGVTDVDDFKADVSGLPTLVEIEASTILAKQAELLRALGLNQENHYMDQTVYSTYAHPSGFDVKLLTSARMRVYSVAGSVGTASDVLATYTITATWTDDELDTYKVVKA